MDFDEFVNTFCDSLTSIKSLNASIGTVTKITGADLTSLKENMSEFDIKHPRVIHQAGTYIICSDSEVLYIGEGGNGNMGHRVYQHLSPDTNPKSKEWKHEVRQIFYVPVNPGEFRRLGEQLAFALHFSKIGSLPKYQKEWR